MLNISALSQVRSLPIPTEPVTADCLPFEAGAHSAVCSDTAGRYLTPAVLFRPVAPPAPPRSPRTPSRAYPRPAWPLRRDDE